VAHSRSQRRLGSPALSSRPQPRQGT
jgi:hypothetical protein